MNITDPIRRNARLKPDAPAVVRPDGAVVSYRNLDRTIDALAARVSQFGLVPGQMVGTAVAGPYRSMVLALALARLGVASVPTSLPAERMALCFADADATVDGQVKRVTLEGPWAQVPPPGMDVRPVPSHEDGDAVCIVFASSGTTGSSKHTAVSHDLMRRRILWKFLALRPREAIRQISMVGGSTSYGFPNLLRVLWVGGLVVFPGSPATAERILAFIQRHQVNILITAPSSLAALVAALPPGAGAPPSLSMIEVSGSALPPRVYDLARQRLCSNIVSLYGSTEASSIASAPMSVLHDHPGAVGYIHSGVEVQAVDGNDVPLPAGTQGELRVRSELCVDAYLDDAVTSAAVFRGGWFYPGDLGAVSRKGLLSLAGRVVDVINRGGVKVSPHVIEDVVSAVAEVKEVAAFGAPNAMDITEIWVAIVPDGTVDMPALRALCTRSLGDAVPDYFVQVKALPRNAAGKILRTELARMAVASKADPPAPRGNGARA